MSVMVRTSVPPGELVPVVKKLVWSLDPNQPVSNIATLKELAQGSSSQKKRRFFAALLGALSFVALGLASISVYSTVGILCRQRQREYSIRMAHGAVPAQIAGLVFRMVCELVKFGVGFGLIFAALGSMAFTDMLFETSPVDVVTFAVATFVLVMMISLASVAHLKKFFNNDVGSQLRNT